MMLPSVESETTLGTSLSASLPGITSGRVRFMCATRLLVVPRSMPTTLSLLSNSIWNMGSGVVRLSDQVGDVFTAVEEAADGEEGFAIVPGVPLGEFVFHFAIDFVAHGF